MCILLNIPIVLGIEVCSDYDIEESSWFAKKSWLCTQDRITRNISCKAIIFISCFSLSSSTCCESSNKDLVEAWLIKKIPSFYIELELGKDFQKCFPFSYICCRSCFKLSSYRYLSVTSLTTDVDRLPTPIDNLPPPRIQNPILRCPLPDLFLLLLVNTLF